MIVYLLAAKTRTFAYECTKTPFVAVADTDVQVFRTVVVFDIDVHVFRTRVVAEADVHVFSTRVAVLLTLMYTFSGQQL